MTWGVPAYAGMTGGVVRMTWGIPTYAGMTGGVAGMTWGGFPPTRE